MTEIKNDKSSQDQLKLRSSKLQLSGGAKNISVSGQKSGVQVEVKKKRSFIKGESKQEEEKQTGVAQEQKTSKADAQNDKLTADEQAKRLAVLKNASESEKQQQQEKRREEEEKNKKAESEVAAALEDASEEAEKAEEKQAEKEVPVEPVEKIEPSTVTPIKTKEKLGFEIKDKTKKADKSEEAAKPKARKGEPKRRSNKLTIAQALSQNEERERSLAAIKRAREKARKAQDAPLKEKEKIIREVIIPEIITVQELANRMAERVVDVTKMLMKMGMMVTANQTIDADTAQLVAEEFGHKFKRVTEADVENVLLNTEDETGKEVEKAPVVTFMGHVDHGKTSLLDAIRKTQITKKEAGGITQHIGAYQVRTKGKKLITFLDTPGHEAFTAMRQRGASATDIVVLVVAADDGIMEQTKEAISHAKAAEVPIIVAINKIDKPEADPQKIKNALLEHDLIPEDLGGDVLLVEVSAKESLNLDKLQDAILLQAEMLELKANPERKAEGVVVEAKIDKGKGAVTSVLIQKGSLKIGDIVVAGEAYGKVRKMMNDRGQSVTLAKPSEPVEILGLNDAPQAGVTFNVVDNDKQAREIIEYREKRTKDLKIASIKKSSLEEMFSKVSNDGKKELTLIIKGDVQGSIEAIKNSVEKLANEEVEIKIIHSGVGAITESDIVLAQASNALVLGFNVRADNTAKEIANKERIDIKYYSIIYNLIDDIKDALSGLLTPKIREQYLGTAEIREIFNISKKIGKVAGCMVVDGTVKKDSKVRLLRDNVVIHEGDLKTLRRFKDDVKEVGTNYECGMAFENYDDIKIGDAIEAFELIEEKRTL